MDINAVKTAIEDAFEEASKVANSAEYDRGVWIGALSAARSKFNAVPVEGNGKEYFQKVCQELSELREFYNDSDGQYTNGKAMIGQVLGYIYQISID